MVNLMMQRELAEDKRKNQTDDDDDGRDEERKRGRGRKRKCCKRKREEGEEERARIAKGVKGYERKEGKGRGRFGGGGVWEEVISFSLCPLPYPFVLELGSRRGVKGHLYCHSPPTVDYLRFRGFYNRSFSRGEGRVPRG